MPVIKLITVILLDVEFVTYRTSLENAAHVGFSPVANVAITVGMGKFGVGVGVGVDVEIGTIAGFLSSTPVAPNTTRTIPIESNKTAKMICTFMGFFIGLRIFKTVG